MDAHGHNHLLLNQGKLQHKQTSCTGLPVFSPSLNFLPFFFHLIIYILQQLKTGTNNHLFLKLTLLLPSVITMARRIKQNYRINVHRAALLNCTPNSTSVSGNALEVTDVHLTLTTATNNAVEDIYQSLGETVQQVEETLQQACRNQADYNNYQDRTLTATAAALLVRDNYRIRTLVLQEANTNIIVQHLAEHQVEDMVARKDEDENPVGNRTLACTICWNTNSSTLLHPEYLMDIQCASSAPAPCLNFIFQSLSL